MKHVVCHVYYVTIGGTARKQFFIPDFKPSLHLHGVSSTKKAAVKFFFSFFLHAKQGSEWEEQQTENRGDKEQK